jgi:predicted glycosyltransferase
MNILIVVTHLLGTGHLRRAMMLARAFDEGGHRVTLASGGTEVPGLETAGVNLVQLPPLKSDGTNFTTLLTGDGVHADAAYLTRRLDLLLDCIKDGPDVLITELFPFGRRVLAPEFMGVLDAAQRLPRPPKILCSIRDILTPPSKPAKAERADQIITQYYDAVLVHSDKAATPLEISWPVSDALRAKLRYTGFVAPPAPEPHPDRAGEGEVLVSAGGGAVGQPVFETSLRAARLTPALHWRLLVGGADPVSAIAGLQAIAPENATVEPARPDFPQMLNHAICSVSLAGYNTAMDLLQTGIPALLIPFDDGGEVEQTLRAQSLAALPGFDMLLSAELSAEAMAQHVTKLSQMFRRPIQGVAMNGAAEALRIVEEIARANT